MKDFIVLGINKSHNASAALLVNNEVVFHIESERISGVKYDPHPFVAINKIKDFVDHIDVLVISGLSETRSSYDTGTDVDAYTATVMGLGKGFSNNSFEIIDLGSQHHATHAYCAFYNSGFDSSLVIVKDGMGSDYKVPGTDYRGKERGTSFTMSYPHNLTTIDKHISIQNPIDNKIIIDNSIYLTNSISEGSAFEAVALALGFDIHDAGKVMGLSAYGNYNSNIPPIYKDGFINTDIFKTYPGGNIPYLNLEIENNISWESDLSYALQTEIQKNVIPYILKMIEKTKEKNLCLTGGFFLNCVLNYELLKFLPKEINVYVEPISSDAGTAIGAAKAVYYYKTKSLEKSIQKNVYYGPKHKYDLKDLDGHLYRLVDAEEVAKLISEKNIVAIYQGKSESGPRALGNRSILYDPRDVGGKDRVNTVKKREFFRPFAGSILFEHMNDWFDMRNLSESKFMTYAVKVLEDKKIFIPAITHVDGTCRVQTVSTEDNNNFYKVIYEFYKITGIPIILNTSFNLAGDTICETLEDSLKTLYNSDIDFLYLPEISALVYKEKEV